LKKKLCNALKGLLLSFLYVIIYVGVQFLLQGIFYLWNVSVNGQSDAEAAKRLLDGTYALSVIGAVISLWIYILIGYKRKRPFAEYVNFRKITNTDFTMAACCAIGSRMLVCVYEHFAGGIEILKKSMENAAETLPETVEGVQMIVLLFAVVAIAPFFEEVLFRGLIQRMLTESLRPWLAIVIQAIMFGVAHGFLFQSAFAFVMGLLLGIVYERTKSILTVVSIHSVFNMSVIITPMEMSNTGIAVFIAGGILLVSFSMFYLVFGPYRNENKKQ